MNISFLLNKNNPDRILSNYLRNVFGFIPKNLELYKIAFIHKSVSGKDAVCGQLNNERLEYLGDAILSAIIADFLFKKYPLHSEGVLTEMRSKIVNRERLNALSKKIGLNTLMKIDTHVHAKSANGDAFEAILGAIYLDQGYEKTKRILLKKIILTHLDIDSIFLEESNFKSKILSWAQKNHQLIEFQHEEDNSSAKKLYKAMALLNGTEIGQGYDYTIKKAEQNAAEKGWEHIENQFQLSKEA
ncbi:MAG: ribonuclease III domain-containing protein [Bacteroidales bacterium]